MNTKHNVIVAANTSGLCDRCNILTQFVSTFQECKNNFAVSCLWTTIIMNHPACMQQIIKHFDVQYFLMGFTSLEFTFRTIYEIYHQTYDWNTFSVDNYVTLFRIISKSLNFYEPCASSMFHFLCDWLQPPYQILAQIYTELCKCKISGIDVMRELWAIPYILRRRKYDLLSCKIYAEIPKMRHYYNGYPIITTFHSITEEYNLPSEVWSLIAYYTFIPPERTDYLPIPILFHLKRGSLIDSN